jgi:hypothetical protein
LACRRQLPPTAESRIRAGATGGEAGSICKQWWWRVEFSGCQTWQVHQTWGLHLIIYSPYVYKRNNTPTDGKMTILTGYDLWSSK